jgi:hypothetical protein
MDPALKTGTPAVGDAPPQAAAAGAGDGGDASAGSSTPGCPICEFIEAGPCGSQHKVSWARHSSDCKSIRWHACATGWRHPTGWRGNMGAPCA